MKHTDEDILDCVEDVMDRLSELDSPDQAALVLLACHAQNYELNAKKDVDMDEYLRQYCERFKGFFVKGDRDA